MMSYKHYNNHTLYIRTGIAHRYQVEEILKNAINQLNIKTEIFVNLISSKDGYCGCAYVWISSPEVYNAIVGKNLDGSERVRYEDDPDWKPPTDSTDKSWGDRMENKECLRTTIYLESLLSFDGYDFDQKQLDNMSNLSTKKGYIKIYQAFVLDVEPNLNRHILIAKNIPEWITEEMLKDKFSPFTSDTKTKIQRFINRKRIFDTYPFINIYNHSNKISKVKLAESGSFTPKIMCFITFNKLTYDGQFALLMTKKLVVYHPKTNKPHTLFFTFSYKKNKY